MAFNENLKKLREARGFTTEDVASKIDVTEKTYINYEEGKSMPKVDVIIKIADLFEILLDELFDREYYRNLIATPVTSGYVNIGDIVDNIDSVTTVAVSDECSSGICENDDNIEDEEYNEVCDDCKIDIDVDTPDAESGIKCVNWDETCECNEDCDNCAECSEDENSVKCPYSSDVTCYDADHCDECVVFDEFISLDHASTMLLATICDMLPDNLSYIADKFEITGGGFDLTPLDYDKYFIVGIRVNKDYRFVIKKKFAEMFESVRYETGNIGSSYVNNLNDFKEFFPSYFNSTYKIKRRLFVKF